MASLDIKWREHFEEFIDISQEERIRSEKRRDYRDLKQWTTEEVSKLEARGQPPIVFDQYSKKVDAITGLEVNRRTDPKAYPVHPKFSDAAEAITDGLRYVESHTMFDSIGSDVFEDKIVEGYGGCITEYNPEGENVEIHRIPWDRIFYDAYSRKLDFSDAKFMGITLWMNLEDAIEKFPDKEDEIRQLMDVNSYDDTTFEDRPSDWINIKRKRVRINQEYYKASDGWIEVYYCGDTIIQDPQPSPYLDCDGNPTNPIELQSDFIDRDNNRWGYMERLIDVQDEINHRRSKALFMLSSKSVIAERGSFGEVSPDEILNELRKGMSFIEYSPLGGEPPQIDSQQELGQSQLAFYQEAQQAMDSVGINPELAGRTESAISGRAFMARQEGGMLELTRILARHSEWKTRVYRQIWYRMKQFWTEEKWIRVTNEQDVMRFVGLNVPITRIEKMMEEQSGMSIDKIRENAGQEVDQFIQQAVSQNPLMGQIVETRNNVVEMDMDIVVEEAPDTFVQQQEQFQTLAQLAGTRADPDMFKALVKLSSLPNKDEILEMFEPKDDPQAQQQAQAAQQLQMAQFQADMEEQQAGTEKTKAEIQKIMSEVVLNDAKTKDELASAVERVGKVSELPVI